MCWLILGCGNLLAGDDAIGLQVVRYLQTQPYPQGTRFREVGTPGLNLLDYWEPEDRVILVDAVQTGAPEGTICRLDLADVLEPIEGQASALKETPATAHEFGIKETLALADLTGDLPTQLRIIGIEIREAQPFQNGLSPALAAAIIPAAQAVLGEIQQSLEEQTFRRSENKSKIYSENMLRKWG